MMCLGERGMMLIDSFLGIKNKGLSHFETFYLRGTVRYASILISCICYFVVSQCGAQSTYNLIHKYLDTASSHLGDGDRPDRTITYVYKAKKLLPKIEKDEQETKERIEFYLVSAFRALHRIDDLITHQKALINLRKDFPDRHFTVQQYLNYHRLGGVYMGSGQTDSASKYLNLGIELVKAVGNQRYLAGALNNMGVFHQKLGNFKKADSLYDKSLEVLKVNTYRDSMLLASIMDNKAEIILNGMLPPAGASYQIDSSNTKEEVEQAIQIIDENFKILRANYAVLLRQGTPHEIRKRVVNVGLKLNHLHLQVRQFEEASRILHSLQEYVKAAGGRTRLNMELLLEDAWINHLKHSKAKGILEHLMRRDSLYNSEKEWFVERQQLVENALTEYAVEKVQSDLIKTTAELNQAKIETNLIRTLFVLGLLFSITVISFIIITYRRRIAMQRLQKDLDQKQIENQNLLNEKLKQDLDYKAKDFSNLLMQSSLKENWAKGVSDKLKMSVKDGNVDEKAIQGIINDLKIQSGLQHKMEVFHRGLKDVNEFFFDKLSQQFPTLTKSEKEVCGYIRMNLSSKEIASLRNIDPQSVRKSRQRIRRKLGLQENQNLTDVLKSI